MLLVEDRGLAVKEVTAKAGGRRPTSRMIFLEIRKRQGRDMGDYGDGQGSEIGSRLSAALMGSAG